ncbi:MAG TPA: cytochrome c oxidase subunit II [Sphingomicrobium sp.]
MTRRAWICAVAILPLAACNRFQNALAGDGADGANFVRLFIIFTIVSAVMFVLVVGALFVALWHKRRADLTVEHGRHQDEPAGFSRALAGWAILIVAGLAALTVASFFTDRSNAADAAHPGLVVTVTGNQFWWDVEYVSGDPSKSFHTANELHLPVGVPVEVKLQATDVIHSFWVPNLAGKQDLIPGRVTDIQLLPRRTGYYRGQCAEFCGVQHAHMALDVTVDSRADFLRWVAAQQRVAFAPAGPAELAGYRYFISRECSSCHNVAGTAASGTIGPDLTHVASRRSLAAGTLPMSRANLARWVADPQAHKSGNAMPTIPLSRNELAALTAYLERLQ